MSCRSKHKRENKAFQGKQKNTFVTGLGKNFLTRILKKSINHKRKKGLIGLH